MLPLQKGLSNHETCHKFMGKKKHAIPHVYIILLIVILLATVLTYIVPAGQFDRETVDNVKMVIPGTYHRIDQTPVNLFDMFVAIPQGFVSMANIVILIYMCVAGMGILTSTGALERVCLLYTSPSPRD